MSKNNPRRTSRAAALWTAVGVAAILLVPSIAVAGPNALYYAGYDDSWGRTLEDDGEVARAPGTALDGIANKVTFGGATPGDGGRFLDARVAQGNGQVNVFAGTLASDTTDHPNTLLPGPVVAVAWYGDWNDLDGDGAIDDIHDDPGDGADEFVWRGRSSETDLAMPLYVHPNPGKFPAGVSGNAVRFRGFTDGSFREDAYTDFTDRDEQLWFNDPARTWAVTPGIYDGGLLIRMTFVTVAEAIQKKGDPLHYDLSDPNALIDVDVYDSLSPELEALYTSVMASLTPTANEIDEIRRTGGPAAEIIDNQVTPVTDPLVDSIRAYQSDGQGEAMRTITPAFPKEPNHVFDDYGGNAIFGGVGDTLGSYNSYAGYQSDVHFFVDAWGEITWHPAVHANSGAGPEVWAERGSADASYAFTTPDDGAYPHGRSTTAIFGVNAEIVAWMDRNGDGFRGAVCNPEDPDEWDASRNTCRSADSVDGRFAPTSGDGSGASLCRESAKGTVTVFPLDGDWEGAVLVKDHDHYGNVVWNQDWQVLLGSEPVSLEWRPCIQNSYTRTSDVILFPAGNPTVTIATVVTMTSGEYVDADGITHTSETVTDFDVYHPSL